MTDILLYTTDDGRSHIQLRAKDQTVWLPQKEIARLFDTSTDNVGLHLKNIFTDGELSREATTEESSVVQTEGSREVHRPVTLYNLDAILAVGYRVRSPRGVQFRRWASTALKEYLIKGFVMDDERLKNPDGRPDYFDMLSFLFLRYLSDNYETAAKKELGKDDPDTRRLEALKLHKKGRMQQLFTSAEEVEV